MSVNMRRKPKIYKSRADTFCEALTNRASLCLIPASHAGHATPCQATSDEMEGCCVDPETWRGLHIDEPRLADSMGHFEHWT